MKISLPLLLCRILICILIVTTVACFYFSVTDTRTTADISEEEKTALLGSTSFRDSVQVLNKLNEFSSLTSEDISYIKHLHLVFKNTTGNRKLIARMICIGAKDPSNTIYLDISSKYTVIPQSEYDKIYEKYSNQGETVYTGVELKLIKETAQASGSNALFKEWQKEELSSYKMVKRVISLTDARNNAKHISSISAIMRPEKLGSGLEDCVIKISFGNGTETQYYIIQQPPNGTILPTDEQMYYTHSILPDATIEDYTTENIAMILEEMGVQQ